MKRVRIKAAIGPEASPPPLPCPPDLGMIGQQCKGEPPRNKAIEILKLETLYVSLDDLPSIDWEVYQRFKGELARKIVDLRLLRP